MKFEKPVINVVKFASDDVITTSGVIEDIDNKKININEIFGDNFQEQNLFI